MRFQPSRHGPAFNVLSAAGRDAYGFAHSPLGALLSWNTDVAPVNVTEYTNVFCFFLDACRLAAMHHNGNRIDFGGAHFGRRPKPALGARKRRR